ncbi:hypothetical protein AT15_07065 [Kosmotoga arenicorallina S304]|uniref:phospholipase D n=1 Tax=Kosmotoga arenicorallina S304 TaxID=1453497 RepID=A0A182C7J6_9BACT|nr:phospholipase D-like domain-containing protein [Kosmotoga arenicorallina]OAA31250.1 hypothetical protein AT15_07065 [Kosmotoga arenicorallina S304]
MSSIKILLTFLVLFFGISLYSSTIEYYSSEKYSLSESVIQLLDTAESTVLFVSYSLDETKVIDKLNELVKRGIYVEGIVDNSSIFRSLSHDLLFKLECDNSQALIHAKFMIIDGHYAVVSTGNLTHGGLSEDSNILLCFKSEEVALGLMNFYQAIKKGERAPDFQVENAYFYLTPHENIDEIILKKLQSAKREIFFLIYAFTDPRFLTVFKYMASKGIDVKGVVDDWNISSSYLYKYFSPGLGLRFNKEKWLLHDKTLIIDRRFIITGSANFTKSAWSKNRELVVIIESEDLAKAFISHFNYLWEVSGYGD